MSRRLLHTDIEPVLGVYAYRVVAMYENGSKQWLERSPQLRTYDAALAYEDKVRQAHNLAPHTDRTKPEGWP